VGPGGLVVFSVRAYSRQPAVEVSLQYLKEFPPYDDAAARLDVLHAFNALMPPAEQFADDRNDRRPNLPLATALATDAHRAAFKGVMMGIIENLRRLV
jgi:hypothetical protein